ncbi:hypothetical protein PMAYCL1PPCAC_07468 [Pristionchus mayeri]|uniref:Uncharacterized protein n=1 Tax=Pristionchus mayeri TaxID=1317129 RepID=A0AAN4ZEX7_9BILA|nr:hypothetical protein PMAYCL1PPCAC_07468 [Pristionchus mayeri]
MLLKLTLLASLAVVAAANQFQCSADTILRFGVEKRVKELQKDCNFHEQSDQQLLCESTADLEKAWKEFVDTADEYSKAVKSCRETVQRNKQRAGSPVRRRRAHKHDHDDGHDDHEREEGHKHRNSRSRRCSLQGYREDGQNPCNPPPIHHVSQKTADDDDRIIREKRSVEHPEQPSFPKTEVRLLRARLQQVGDMDEAAAESAPHATFEGDDHIRKEDQDNSSAEKGETEQMENKEGAELPYEPEFSPADIPHLSELSSVNSAEMLSDHTRPSIHTSSLDDDIIGRPLPMDSPSSYSVIEDDDVEDQERQLSIDDAIIDRTVRDIRRIRRAHDVKQSRARRGDCSVAGNQEMHKLQEKYMKHCERENICLPDEDLGPNAAEDFKKLHKKHAATYAAYVRELSACYGSLKN